MQNIGAIPKCSCCVPISILFRALPVRLFTSRSINYFELKN